MPSNPWSARKDSLGNNTFFANQNTAKPALASNAEAVNATVTAAVVHTTVIQPTIDVLCSLQKASSVQTNTSAVNKKGLYFVENLMDKVQAQIQPTSTVKKDDVAAAKKDDVEALSENSVQEHEYHAPQPKG